MELGSVLQKCKEPECSYRAENERSLYFHNLRKHKVSLIRGHKLLGYWHGIEIPVEIEVSVFHDIV